MTTSDDEFRFLATDARDVGVTGDLPRVERMSLTLEDGRSLSALRFGDAPPAVTFVHGAGLNAHTWDSTILALGLPALAIDLPGHGDSSWRTDAAYTATNLAPDVATGIRAWASGPQLVVGHSLGGLTGAALAASAPELVAQLIMVDITPGIDPNAGAAQIRAFFAGPTDWASRDEMVDRAMAFGLGGGTREKTERGVYLNSRVREDGRVEWKHHFAHLAAALAAAPEVAAQVDAQQDALSEILSTTGWNDVAAVAAPLTLIRGEHGFVTAEDAAEFMGRRPDAVLVALPTGHNVHEEAPRSLAGTIAELGDTRQR
ncbi:alpha/beta hydrolase [Microbacterium schleiferi]|uniref:Alpha/beta hydrolase n=1 Tax=Microbacterium schleiferi TaxID=69362 RepID=A0A7S8RHB8_9MICO|nr:alpha/beta hydrolase [Microbacterium schleiferi]QPE05261.1 alpha/beta hydrolase [Microbacterium schleiferi]